MFATDAAHGGEKVNIIDIFLNFIEQQKNKIYIFNVCYVLLSNGGIKFGEHKKGSVFI